MDSYVLVQSALNACHSHSSNNRSEIERSSSCHCFFCRGSFAASGIQKWIRPRGTATEDTALCPLCGVDSVIGDASGYEMTPAFLGAMHEFWFERKVLPEDFDYSWFEPIKI